MVTCHSGSPHDRDPRRWQKCLDQAKANMLAAGWVPNCGKFWEHQHKKAHKLWAAK